MKAAMKKTVAAIEAAGAANVSDSSHPRYILSQIDTELLAAAARGEFDLNELARIELASRGMDSDCVWRGFAKAREIHGVPHSVTAP